MNNDIKPTQRLSLMTAVGDSLIDPLTDPRMNIEPVSLGKYHAPLTHAQSFEALQRAIESRQLEVVQRVCALNKTGTEFFTIMELAGAHRDYSDLFAARWSQSSKIATSAAGGSGTWICSNLCIGGTKVLNLKHTKNMEGKLQIGYEAGIDQVLEQNKDQARLLEAFRTTELTNSQADSIMMEMLRQDIITSNHIKKVDLEYQNPRYDDHAEDGFTVHRLDAAVTEVAFKKANGTSAQELLYSRGPALRKLLKRVVTKLSGFK